MKIHKNKIQSLSFLTAILLLLLLSFQSYAKEYSSITEYVEQHGELTVFSEMLRTGQLHKTLDAEQYYTVFAFTDDVYNLILGSVRDDSLNAREFLSWRVRLISNHIFKDIIELPYTEFPNEITSIAGNKILFEKSKGDYFLNNARIISRPVSTGNGVVMLIDAIIIP